MEPTQTRMSLPKAVADMWMERLDWYEGDPESYDMGPEDVERCRTLIRSPMKSLKTRNVYTIPYYGSDHPLTELVFRALNFAIYDTYSLREEITSSQETKLQKMLKNWVAHGQFKMDPPKPKPKPSPAVLAHQKYVSETLWGYVTHAFSLLTHNDSPLIIKSSVVHDLVMRENWDPYFYRSYGGCKDYKPYLSFSLSGYNLDKNDQPPGTMDYIEYANIQNSPIIGSCKGPWQIPLATKVAHEVAHVAQHLVLWNMRKYIRQDKIGKNALEKPHGQGWQEIYRYLRQNWVNQMDGYQQF